MRNIMSGRTHWQMAGATDAPPRDRVGWDPATGNLLLYGIGGSGTSTALAALALAWARSIAPDELHLYVLDLGAGDLAPLQALPHTRAHVAAAPPEPHPRLLRLLRRPLDTTTPSPPTPPL